MPYAPTHPPPIFGPEFVYRSKNPLSPMVRLVVGGGWAGWLGGLVGWVGWVGWLAGWAGWLGGLVGWLAGWQVGWLAGWLVGRLAGWLVGWLAEWPGWLVGWLAGWLVGWLAGGAAWEEEFSDWHGDHWDEEVACGAAEEDQVGGFWRQQMRRRAEDTDEQVAGGAADEEQAGGLAVAGQVGEEKGGGAAKEEEGDCHLFADSGMEVVAGAALEEVFCGRHGDNGEKEMAGLASEADRA